MISNAMFQVIAEVVREYSHEAYTESKNIHTTGVVGSRAEITGDYESYIGQWRWYKTLNPTVNVLSTTDATDGVTTDVSTDMAKYIKTARSHGAEQVNLQKTISQEDGLKKIARDFAQTRSEDEGKSLFEVLKGVAASEVTRGDAGGAGGGGLTTFESDADNAGLGNFVDLNAEGFFGAAATGANNSRSLFDPAGAGAAGGERLFQAVGMVFKDYEPDYMYMLSSPETYAQLRSANLVDETTITEGNIEFSTVFNGKFRLLPTRANMMPTVAGGDLNALSTKMTMLMKPAAVSFAPVTIEKPVGIDNDESAYMGGGTTEMWYRWGYVWHAEGFEWTGAEDAFATNAAYGSAASWGRKSKALDLPFLPIFHS